MTSTALFAELRPVIPRRVERDSLIPLREKVDARSAAG